MQTTISGHWFDGKQAKAYEVSLLLTSDGRLQMQPAIRPPVLLSSLRVSPRIANSVRCLHFADGSVFETCDSDTVDSLLRCAGTKPEHDVFQQWVHRLERHWLVVFASVLLLVAGSLWFARYGAPIAAREIAFRLPSPVMTYIGRDSLALLDRAMFQDSALDAARQKNLQLLFEKLLPDDREGLQYRLLFRAGGRVGPNAFALPDATIVMTDELVLLAENEQQLAVVLLHEIGHVRERHLLRQLIQQAGLAALLAAVTGDIGGASELVLTLPGVLMQAQYSQAMETEADSYALAMLAQHQLPPQAFVQIMQRMEAWHAEKSGAGEVSEQSDEGDGLGDYLSSHPATAERIRRFEAAAVAP